MNRGIKKSAVTFTPDQQPGQWPCQHGRSDPHVMWPLSSWSWTCTGYQSDEYLARVAARTALETGVFAVRFLLSNTQPATETPPTTVRLTGYERDVLVDVVQMAIAERFQSEWATLAPQIDALDNVLEQLR